MEAIRRAAEGVRRHTRAARDTVRRAWAEPGRERDLVVQAGKAALAAWLAWAVAGWWLQAPMAFVAPWVAIVLVESTVYRSIAHGLQQLAAIATGTVLATAAALLLDSTMAAMGLVLPLAVLLGNWRRLGSQGVYAATGALFVLTFQPVTVAGSAARIAEAVFGAVVGIAVNALVRPPVYLRSTRAALEDAAGEAEGILEAVADGLVSGEWDADAAGSLHERALRLGRLVDQARAAVGWSRESLRVNPWGLGRAASAPGQDYDDAVTVLDYVAVHTAGVTRAVLEACDDDREEPRPGPHITEPYAAFLRNSAHAIRLYTTSRFAPDGRDREADQELREAVENLGRTLDDLRRRLPRAVPDDPDALATYGTLLIQARRLADQLVER
ncbi:FUSC family protein [Streptomyces sp.]|uniref:FUSC family protein n=1 Tax=Streptomyces sp. TaxID=1931 RepID=UPI002D5A0B9F|nr:aromatic acid exporter family protein [Streptomyces sp.]HZF89151.1 aromatic acid exporter family protein [Streptomyces sp.]